jgi:hypothetical protein
MANENFNVSAINVLAADETEINGLKEKTISNFITQCKINDKQNVVNRIVINLTDERFLYKESVLVYFALALAQNGFSDPSDEIFQKINNIRGGAPEQEV